MKSFVASLRQPLATYQGPEYQVQEKNHLPWRKHCHYQVAWLAYWFLLPFFQGLHEYSVRPDIFATKWGRPQINLALSLFVVTQICLHWYFLMTVLFPLQQIYISISAVGNIQCSIDLASELPYLMHTTLQARIYRSFFLFNIARPCIGLCSHGDPVPITRKV